MKVLRLLCCLGCLLPVSPLHAQAEEPQPTEETAESAAIHQWQQLLATPSLSSITSADTASIENALPAPAEAGGASLTLGSTSSLGNYKFPFTLELPVFPLAHDLKSPLRRYRFSVKYDPLLVQRPAGQLTGISSVAERKGSLTLSYQLKGPPPGTKPTSTQPTGTKDHELNLKAKVGYDWDTREGKPSSLDAILDASEVWIKPLDLIVNGSLGETRFVSTQAAPSYSKLNIKISASTKVFPKRLMSVASLSAELSRDQYSGSGFAGIEGITDKSRHTDYSLKEVLAYKINQNHAVRISVAEPHLGTRDHDLVLGVELGVNLAWPYNSRHPLG
jgi:hypothetical protein